MTTPLIERHRTAIGRAGLSRPLRLALEQGVLNPGQGVMDYGCGRGDDAARLQANGFEVSAWDPYHRPEGQRAEQDVVNLGYVLNVIESPAERAETLRLAWGLTRRVLVVAAQVWIHDQARHKIPFGDGVVTGRNTFQKYYDQDELGAFIQATLGVEPVPAGLGIFYAFRDPAEALRVRVGFLRRRVSLLEPERAPRPRRGQTLDPEQAQAQAERREDLLLTLALMQFRGRPRFGALPQDMQQELRALLGPYTRACEQADALLFSLRDYAQVRAAAAESRVGKRLPDALYVHTSAMAQAPLLLRLLQGCAQAFVGEVEDANLIKLHLNRPAVGYLSYPDFDTDPHPALHRVVDVDLAGRFVRVNDYSGRANPPILHRRELFVAEGYPNREEMARITKEEEDLGLYDQGLSEIGTRDGWARVCASVGETAGDKQASRVLHPRPLSES